MAQASSGSPAINESSPDETSEVRHDGSQQPENPDSTCQGSAEQTSANRDSSHTGMTGTDRAGTCTADTAATNIGRADAATTGTGMSDMHSPNNGSTSNGTSLQEPVDAYHTAVTIRDVAKAAGVATSTVSRAFSRPGRVSSATAQRIHDIADKLGYRASAIRSFDPNEEFNRMIAIVVADISNPVFAEYTRSAQHQCFANNLGLLVIDSEENATVERNAIRLSSRHIDGIILASSRLSDTGIRKLAQIKPVIAMNRSIRGVQSVMSDPQIGLEQAVDHLIMLGHKTITYLGGPDTSWQDGMRWRELSAICSTRHLKLRRVPSGVPTFSGGYRCRELFLANPSDTVIAYNDIMAIGFIAALHAKGISVPAQVSVVGIDDVQFSSLVTPALSTVRLPRKELGSRVVDEMVELLHHTKRGDHMRPVILDSTFIVRASTGKAIEGLR